MRASSFSKADLDLFTDLDRAARALEITPCLIGAGAIRLGSELGWQVRLQRMTEDWDFAVRIDSWERFNELAVMLVAPNGGFKDSREPHRFMHKSGGILDVLPYGNLEQPKGSIEWKDELVMSTSGLEVLDTHFHEHQFDNQRLRTASRAAMVGLKLLAYRARRPSITRDLSDVQAILVGAEESINEERVEQEALGRLQSGEIAFAEVGAYLLGREVARAFGKQDCGLMRHVLQKFGQPGDPALGHALGSASGIPTVGQPEANRIPALLLGIGDT